MGQPERLDKDFYQVSTRSSTRKQKERRLKTRRKEPEVSIRNPESSGTITDSSDDHAQVNNNAGDKFETTGTLPDISEDVRNELNAETEVLERRVRFEETEDFLRPDARIRVDEYDILQDIKERKANVTIGQLLHDNTNYQKQLKGALIRPRRRAVRLPPVAINFLGVEDFGAPEISVEIDGCVIPNVPVDGGSGVNLLLETTAADLGYTAVEPTTQTLRMADQSKVVPIGKLSGVPTQISGITYDLNYLVIRVEKGRSFPLLC